MCEVVKEELEERTNYMIIVHLKVIAIEFLYCGKMEPEKRDVFP